MSYTIGKLVMSLLRICMSLVSKPNYLVARGLKRKKNRVPFLRCLKGLKNFWHGVTFLTSRAFSLLEAIFKCGLQQPQNLENVIFLVYFSNLTSDMDYPWLEDLKKVYSVGGLLEVRLASNGGHVTWSKLTLHDVPFWASHNIHISSLNIFWLFVNFCSL